MGSTGAPLGDRLCLLCLEAIFFISHWPVVLIGEAQSRHFNNYFLDELENLKD